MVTQIIPVKNINATQLIRDLTPLIPTTSTVTANEGGNSLIMTDTQMNINRVAQIVTALDGTVSSSSTVKVFALKFADAKALAATIKDLLPAEPDRFLPRWWRPRRRRRPPGRRW
jgi:general secretion pathway protein D